MSVLKMLNTVAIFGEGYARYGSDVACLIQDKVNNPGLKKSGLAWQVSYFISRWGLLSRDKK